MALVVDPRLEVDAAKRHGSGDRVEGGLGNGDADHETYLGAAADGGWGLHYRSFLEREVRVIAPVLSESMKECREVR